jgi:hypothetical protein
MAGAAPAARIALEDAPRHKLINVPRRSIGRNAFKLRPSRTGEFSGKAVKQAIDHVALARVERRGRFLCGKLRGLFSADFNILSKICGE